MRRQTFAEILIAIEPIAALTKIGANGILASSSFRTVVFLLQALINICKQITSFLSFLYALKMQCLASFLEGISYRKQ